MVSGFSGQGETMKVVVGHKKQNNKKFYMLLTESLTAWLLAAGIVLTAVQALGIEISRFFVLIVTLIPVLILELIPWEVFAEGASLLLVAGVVVLTLIGQKNFMNGLIVLNNCIAETVGKNRGISWPQYMLQSTETAGSDMMIAAGVFGLLDYVLDSKIWKDVDSHNDSRSSCRNRGTDGKPCGNRGNGTDCMRSVGNDFCPYLWTWKKSGIWRTF